ncbi:MAG: hypothetical protein DME57_05665, partial [Verrucomicrobia bacterium]
ATTLFLPPNWPRRVVSIFRRGHSLSAAEETASGATRNQSAIFALVIAYLALQFLIPLHPFVFSRGTQWAWMQHRFCWRMMLQRQSVKGFFYITDPTTGRTNRVAPPDFLTRLQLVRLYWQPDTVLQCAHFLSETMPRRATQPLTVEARIFVSINGRRPELFVNPNTNLAAESRSFFPPRWVMATREALPPRGEDFSEDLFGTAQPVRN